MGVSGGRGGQKVADRYCGCSVEEDEEEEEVGRPRFSDPFGHKE